MLPAPKFVVYLLKIKKLEPKPEKSGEIAQDSTKDSYVGEFSRAFQRSCAGTLFLCQVKQEFRTLCNFTEITGNHLLMKGKILVIDDEPQFERLMLQRFRKKVREGVYEFLFAQDGLEALELIKQEPSIDIVLTDINMPRMDGLTFLSELKSIRPGLKTVVVSAYGDMKNIRTAMNRGAFDFVIKPIEFEDLEKTIQKTLEETAIVKKAAQAKELEEKNEHLQELDHFKTEFFTNISHEFRTPLTVIRGMADQIEESPQRWTSRGIQMIRRNTNSLLELVNQILELRQLEMGKWQIRPIHADITAYIRYIFDSFQLLAETRDIQMQLEGSEEPIEMDYDPEKFLRVLSNLLDNALKFTPAGGQIQLQWQREDNELILRIKDTGAGISPALLPHIFDRFFYRPNDQNNPNGSGIGLSLVSELIKLMEGEISVESQIGSGTAFTIHLPIRNEADAQEVNHPAASPAKLASMPSAEVVSTLDASSDLPLLLIVEDHPDVSAYLAACLEGRYRLIFAKDGQEGIDKALAEIPDIIISDVMMPKKSGLELCQTIKHDARTNHIPIVLLTAKADFDAKMEGLEQGADAYLAKPFEKKELLLRLEKLLELRERLQARYSQPFEAPAAETEPSEEEDAFIVELRKTVHDHMEDEGFGIPELCKAMAVSRTQLHRKIKALTGRSTSSFVRSLRLVKARELLKSTDWNISQVAYEVGFRDPKYFSRTFTEEYGISPKNAR